MKRGAQIQPKRKTVTQSKILIIGIALLAFIILQSTFAMPSPASAAARSAQVNQRATLPPEWTATFTASPPAITSTPLPTIDLEGHSKTALPQSPTVSPITGKQVIVDVDALSIYTWSAEDQPVIEKAPRGAVKTILVEAQAASANDIWWYIADGYGWIPAKINGVPTVRDYSPDALNQMEQETDAAIQKDPQNAKLHLQKGWMYYSQQNYASAISELNIAIDLMKGSVQSDPKFYAQLYDYRGKIYLDMQDNLNALQDFDEAIQLGLEEASVYDRRGIANLQLQKYEQARADYEQALRLNPHYAVLYNNMGALLDAIHPQDPAQLDYFAKAIETDIYFPYSYTNRAHYYRHNNDYGDYVINDYTTALSLLPHDKDILANRALAYMMRQEYTLSLQDFDLIIQLYPDYTDAYSDRGGVYARMGDRKSALKDFLMAVKLGDTTGLAYYNLGVLLHQDRQYVAALYCYNKALEINPNRRDAQLNRAQIYELLGGYDEKQIMSNPSVEALITPMP